MTNIDEVERPRRGRPPMITAEAVRPEIKTEPMVEKKPDPKMIEVKIVRKYVPHLCYETDEEMNLVPVRTPEGNLLRQDRVVTGETKDKFGRTIPTYREHFEAVDEGTVIALPADEATRVLKLGIAEITDRSF